MRINYDWCLSHGRLGCYRSWNRTGRERMKGLYVARKRGKATKARTFDAASAPPPPPPTPMRRDAALWNFCGTAFFNWCNSNQPPVPPGTLVKLFVARRVRIRSSGAFSRHRRSFALITEKHSARALLGHIKLLRNCSVVRNYAAP